MNDDNETKKFHGDARPQEAPRPDIPFPTHLGREDTQQDAPAAAPEPSLGRRPEVPRAGLSIAAFHDEARAHIDARKEHLARVGIRAPGADADHVPGGILPEHAQALRAPDLDGRLAAPTVRRVPVLDEARAAEGKAPELPDLPGVNKRLEE